MITLYYTEAFMPPSLSSSVSYSQEESYRARELLSCVAQLQPLVFGLADELLAVSLELNMSRLQQVLDSLTQQVRREEKHRKQHGLSSKS